MTRKKIATVSACLLLATICLARPSGFKYVGTPADRNAMKDKNNNVSVRLVDEYDNLVPLTFETGGHEIRDVHVDVGGRETILRFVDRHLTGYRAFMDGPVQPDFKTDRDGMAAAYAEYYRQVKGRTVR